MFCMKRIVSIRAIVILFIWFFALNALCAMTFCIADKSWVIHIGYYALWVIFLWVTFKMFPKE